MLTMKEIALRADVTRQTVSAVVNHKAWVSQATRERVERIIQEAGYQPNRHARSLAGQASHLIGVIVRDIQNPFFTKLIDAIDAALTPAGYTILYVNIKESVENEIRAIQTLMAYHVDGIIITPAHGAASRDHLWHLSQSSTPFVSLHPLPGIRGNSVTMDDQAAGFLAAEHLIETGHRHFCFLQGPPGATSTTERIQGYKNALLKYHVPFDETMIVPAGHRPEHGYQAALGVLRKKDNPFTALIAFSDFVALGVYKAAHELGIAIPDQLSVVSFDDVDIAELLGPSLTTIRLPITEMGTEMAGILIAAIASKNTGLEPVVKILPLRLIQRHSVRGL
ncbi:MAG: LacI family DNA-binding transcriptional regulator [Candidatus Sumerlaeota bacterium]|nr:LacI family DNA-binding transcriptional regulator [Candidatus Sumerlaeota bacterium]